jgi:ubiquinone biosynthesis protein
VHVPAVEPALSSGRVLTLEFIDGVKSTGHGRHRRRGLDRRELARNLVRGAVQMVMIDGFFHADPHPGNVVVELQNGPPHLPRHRHGRRARSAQAASASRGFLIAFPRPGRCGAGRDAPLAQPAASAIPDVGAFQRQFEQRIGPLIDPPPGHPPQLQKLVSEALDVLRDSGYRLDSQLTLAVKAVAQARRSRRL